MATSTIFNFNFNNSEIVDSTGQWYDATTGTPTTEFIEHDGNTALLQRAYIAGTAYTRDINPVFFQSRDPTFTAHTYTIELQLYPLKDPGGANFGPESGPVLDFNPNESDEEGWVKLRTLQGASKSNTFYWHEYGLGTGIPFLTVTAADGTYNRWYSIRIERVDDGTNTGATIKIYVDGTLVVNETLTYAQDARRGRISDSIRYTYRRSSIDPQGAGAAIDNFKLTAGIAPSSVVDVSLANLQRNNANLLSFIKGKVPAVNDGTLTIQKNGTNVATFTANASTNATANITVPTKTSDLTNDSGFITEDNTKIPLAGSNAISGSLIPATTDAYDLGGPSYQWNNAYIKSLTINGVACGDILTHNASEFVDLTSNQTIGGNKAFSGSFSINKPSPRLQIKSTTYSSETSSAMTIGEIALLNNNGGLSAWIVHQLRDDLTKRLCFRVYPHPDGSYKGFVFDDNCNLYPENANSALGTSANKWKLFNGINPGALSLPGTNLIDIASSITALDGTTINKFTPQVNGWLLINGTGTANDGFIYAVQGQIGMMSANNTIMLRCAVLIPVVAGVEVSVTCKLNTLTWANIAPCQGNV